MHDLGLSGTMAFRTTVADSSSAKCRRRRTTPAAIIESKNIAKQNVLERDGDKMEQKHAAKNSCGRGRVARAS
eukprot:337971-Amphidinium_carterae.1